MYARFWGFVFCLFIFGFSHPPGSTAQIVASRNVVVAPLDDTTAAGGFLANVGLFGSFGRGYGSTGGEQAWNYKLGGFFELWRWGDRASLLVLLSHEMAANPHNAISFNPRGALAEENVLFMRRERGFTWHLSGFTRCKHDIDNGEPETLIPPPVGEMEQRVLVIRGVQAGLHTEPILLRGRATVRLFARGDLNLSFDDWRLPTPEGAVAASKGALLAGGFGAVPLRTGLELYGRAWTQPFFFSDEVKVNGRLELGLNGLGLKGTMGVYAAWERFFDDYARAVPQASQVFYVGLRASSQLIF